MDDISIEKLIQSTIRVTLLKAHPVGSLDIRVDEQNPGSLYGGTWEKIEGKFLLSSSSSHTLGDTGGEETHTLSVQEMPSHMHKYGYVDFDAGKPTYAADPIWSTILDLINHDKKNLETTYVGGSQAHNNMPPFLVVNTWKRTA